MHDNPRNLGLDVLDVVNLRLGGQFGPDDSSVEAPLSVLAELQQQGLIRHIGLSNISRAQFDEGSRIAAIVCVQNHYNLAHRSDDALIDDLAAKQVAYVPFFPWAASARATRPFWTASRKASGRRPARWRSRGCCNARRTCC